MASSSDTPNVEHVTLGHVNLGHFGHEVTMHVQVRLTRGFRLRIWIALKLMRLAAWLMGSDYDERVE